MTIRCPNKDCNTKMALPLNVIQNSQANAKCPSCKQYFKPFDLLPDSEKERLQNNKSEKVNNKEEKTHLKNDEKTDFNKKPVGWLVVHDEKTHSQTYDLFEGRQVIGRKSVSRPCEIMIETGDTTMSRNHFSLEVRNHGGRYSYTLKDYGSTNRTYIETKVLSDFEREMRRVREGEEVYIEDGAVIQAGNTKIILKSLKSVNNKEQATQIVSNQKITKTVIL